MKTLLNVLFACAFSLSLPSAALYGEHFGVALLGAASFFYFLTLFISDTREA